MAVEAPSSGGGRRGDGRPLSAEVGEGDGGGRLAAREFGEETRAEGWVRASRDEAAGALVLALEEREGAARAGGGLLKAAELEGFEPEAAEFARDAEPEETATAHLRERVAEGAEILVDRRGARPDPRGEEFFAVDGHGSIVRIRAVRDRT